MFSLGNRLRPRGFATETLALALALATALAAGLLLRRDEQFEQDHVFGLFSTGGSKQCAWNPCSHEVQISKGS